MSKTNITPKVKQLYLQAFPDYERWPFELLVYKSKEKNSDFHAIYDGSEYVDLLHLTYYQDIVYIFYLAIDPSQQSKGYESEIIQHLRKIYKNNRLLLNIVDCKIKLDK